MSQRNVILAACSAQEEGNNALLEKIKLPDGFAIEMYAPDVPNARGMDLADDGNLFVGSRNNGNIYAITSDRAVIVIDQGVEMPAGLDYYNGDFYVSAVSKIFKYPGIIENLEAHVAALGMRF